MSKSDKKRRSGNWIFNNNAVMVFSIFLAAFIWIVVAMTVGRTTDKSFYSVPVDIELQAGAFVDQGFYPVNVDYVTVSARVVGDRVAVNRLTTEDLIATVKPSIAVTETGPYMLKLVPSNTSLDSELLSDIEYTPSEVMVRVDRLISKSFKLEVAVNGLTTPEGYVRGAQTVTPSSVTVRGPRAEIEKITRCVVMADLNVSLERTYVEDLPIVLLDAQGDKIDISSNRISLDYSEARVVIEMLKRTMLSLEIGFTNIPRNFPVDLLKYAMSAHAIEVAAPVDSIGNEMEIDVGYIDIRNIYPGNDIFRFPLEIPEGYENLDGFNEITVTFDSASWEETLFNTSGVKLLNKPDRYDIAVSGDTFYNVIFVGDGDTLANMTGDDIVMEVDLAERDISEGEIRVPVKISAPTKGFVWAVGEYNVILEIKEKAA